METNNSLEEKEKMIYLTQIQHLDRQLERCQLKCEELKKQNKQLVTLCACVTEDMNDISEYLKKMVSEEEQKVSKLEEKLEIQRQAVDQDLEQLELQQTQQREEKKELLGKLKSEMQAQAVQLEEQKDLTERLKQHLCEIDILKEQLLSEKEKHEAAVESLKKSAEQEQEKITDEISAWYEARFSDIIQRVEAEHSELSQELELLLDQFGKLLKDQMPLKINENHLQSEITETKQTLKMIEEQNSTYKMRMEVLMQVNQKLKGKLEKQSVIDGHKLVKLQELSQQVDSVSEDHRHKTAHADQLRLALKDQRTRVGQLEDNIQEAATILTHLLLDSEKTSETQMYQKLLEILETNAPPETNFAIRGSTEQRSSGCNSQMMDPKSARAETLNPDTEALFLLARLRPGDLGIIPRPRRSATSRTGGQST